MPRKQLEGFQANRPEINTVAMVGWRSSDLPIGLKSSSRRMGLWARADVPIRFAKRGGGRWGAVGFLSAFSLNLRASLDHLTWLVEGHRAEGIYAPAKTECGCAKKIFSRARAVAHTHTGRRWHEDDEMTTKIRRAGWPRTPEDVTGLFGMRRRPSS
ncbi:hypothetical protein PG994_005722 [Apiospora phragmitis]|uniref:C2H2-type domain-containing protein n=1 Tax=Apiospora phragmitis TaxID=2905665 RepID=A0ABR1VD06_9PEZI